MSLKLTVNKQIRTVDAAPDTPLLWVLRDVLDIKGPKYGCGLGLCGACTVIIAGQAVRSASALLAEKPHPTDAEIDDAMSGNLCRCGTYPRIRQAIHLAAQSGHAAAPAHKS